MKQEDMNDFHALKPRINRRFLLSDRYKNVSWRSVAASTYFNVSIFFPLTNFVDFEVDFILTETNIN